MRTMNNFNSLNKFNKDLAVNLRDTISSDWNNYLKPSSNTDMHVQIGRAPGGKCNIVYDDGSEYAGEVLNGKYHGHGVFTFINGHT